MTEKYCNRCRSWVSQLYEVPHRYTAALVGVNDKIFSLAEYHKVIDIWHLEKGVCAYCISELANKRRKNSELVKMREAGHLFRISTRKIEKGYVYIAIHEKEIYKIGATLRTVPDRMSQQGYYPYQFLHALETHDAWGLEAFLHHHFRDKRISLREFFKLQKYDFEFIGKIKTFNLKPVKHMEAYE